MNKVFEVIGNLANAFAKTGDVCKASYVANVLNENNHKTTRGGFFSVLGRGIYKVISAAYDYFMKKGDKETASNIASTFVNEKGKHSWKK